MQISGDFGKYDSTMENRLARKLQTGRGGGIYREGNCESANSWTVMREVENNTKKKKAKFMGGSRMCKA